jgi:hypothetical protein
MIIVGSSISQNWGKNQKKKKKLCYHWNEKNAKKEISLLFTDIHS